MLEIPHAALTGASCSTAPQPAFNEMKRGMEKEGGKEEVKGIGLKKLR